MSWLIASCATTYFKTHFNLNTYVHQRHNDAGCPNGQYYSTFASTCLDCPENSTSSQVVASLECVCIDGYYFIPKRKNLNESCGKSLATKLLL